MECQRASWSALLSSTSVLSKDYKVDHQPAGDGEKDGTVATKRVTEKVKTGRLQQENREVDGDRYVAFGTADLHDVIVG